MLAKVTHLPLPETHSPHHYYTMTDYIRRFDPVLFEFGYPLESPECDLWLAHREAQPGIEPTVTKEGVRLFHAALCDHRLTVLAGGGP